MAKCTPVAIVLSCSVALAASAGGPAASQGWTRFRGPNGTGITDATGLPVKWTEADYNWKAKLPGKGHSSPVIWGTRIFLTCGEPKTAQRIILCLKTRDGAIAWERRYDSTPHQLNPSNSYASSTPAVDGERLYVYWTTPEEVTLLALSHEGKEAWRRNLGGFVSEHGSGTSPIVVDNLVVLCNDQEGKSSLLAFDCKTGETRWEAERRTAKATYGAPCLYHPQDGPPELIFNSMAHGVTSIDPKTGKVNWEFAKAFPLRVVASPILASGLIIGTCGTGGSGRRLVAVRPGSKAKGVEPKLAYEIKRAVPYAVTPLAKDGLLFLWHDNGTVACVRAETGEELWRQRLGDRFYGSAVWAEGRLYAISRKGIVYVLAASEKFQVLAKNPLGEPSHATPAIANGTMYLRTFSHLISIGGRE
jgi:hypothetical protein